MQRTRAIALRQYPFREADRIVSFFTRDFGFLKGVARGSFKMKSKITGALEPLTLVNLRFIEPHGKELVAITGCDAISSLVHSANDLVTKSAISLLVEITAEMLPERDPNEAMYRLLVLCHNELRAGTEPLLVMRYFELFSLKLTGFQPIASDLRNKRARELMGKLLKSHLGDVRQFDNEALSQLGNFLRLELRNVLGKQLKTYLFLDRMRAVKNNNSQKN